MGMFTQRPEDPGAWAALPGDPHDGPDEGVLPELVTDPFALRLGGAGPVTETLTFSVAPEPAPELDADAE